MNSRKLVTLLLHVFVLAAFLAAKASAADIDDLKNAYYGNHWSLVNPQLEPQPGLLTITAKHGKSFDATLEKIGGHNGQKIVAIGSGRVEPSGHVRWVGYVYDNSKPVIKVTFQGWLSVTGKAIGGGDFTARGAFPDGTKIDDRSFFQWETPLPPHP